MAEKSIHLLRELTGAHSTPGDEQAVAAILAKEWTRSGWRVREHGGYALSAERKKPGGTKRPRLLICAHMDSPGFIVDRPGWRLSGNSVNARVHLTTLGSPCFEGRRTAARLKCRNGIFAGIIRKKGALDCPEYDFETPRAVAESADIGIGDRVCFAADFAADESVITAPALDNRAGCWMLCRLAGAQPGWNRRFELVLGAVGSEEMGGFGAHVLAARVQADLVIVLDTTYEAEEQGVRLGGGAVLTLSDQSILVSPAQRDRLAHIMTKAKVPIQFEAYNYSGTDARAFPLQGCCTPVIALLLPSRGNHSPRESAALADLDHWERAVRALEKFYGNLHFSQRQ